MQNSDLKNVLISAIETADNRLLSMLYAVIKSYQITESASSLPVQEASAPEEVASPAKRVYKDDRPRRAVRVYRKPKVNVIAEAVDGKIVSTPLVAASAPRVARLDDASSRNTTITTTVKPTTTEVKEKAVSGKSNNGGFITDLMTKTVSKNALPA